MEIKKTNTEGVHTSHNKKKVLTTKRMGGGLRRSDVRSGTENAGITIPSACFLVAVPFCVFVQDFGAFFRLDNNALQSKDNVVQLACTTTEVFGLIEQCMTRHTEQTTAHGPTIKRTKGGAVRQNVNLERLRATATAGGAKCSWFSPLLGLCPDTQRYVLQKALANVDDGFSAKWLRAECDRLKRRTACEAHIVAVAAVQDWDEGVRTLEPIFNKAFINRYVHLYNAVPLRRLNGPDTCPTELHQAVTEKCHLLTAARTSGPAGQQA